MNLGGLASVRHAMLERNIFDRSKKTQNTKSQPIEMSEIKEILRQKSELERRQIRKKTKREVKNEESKRTIKKENAKHMEQKKVKLLTYYFTNRLEELHQMQSKKKQTNELKHWLLPENNKLKEFLSSQELFEIRRFYSDYNLGDAMLVFDNPDDSKASKGISLKEALAIFDKCLSVVTSDPVSKMRLKWEKEAFVRGFLTLEDLKEVEEALDEPKWWEKLLRRKRPSPKYTSVKSEEITANHTGGGFHRRNSRVETTQVDEEILNGNEWLQEKYAKTKHNIVKKLYKGRFLDKRDAEDWLCSNEKPRDFSTLLRNVIISKLSLNSNTHVRSFLSSDGKKIFLVLKTTEYMLQKVAEQSGLNKQMEFGKVDLLSLEPVDSRYRPLRLKKNNFRDILSALKIEKREKQRVELDESDSEEVPTESNKELKKIFESHQTIKESVLLDYLNSLTKPGDLLKHVVWIVEKFEKHINNIANLIGIDLSHERQELVDDIPLDDDTLKVFFVYCWIFIRRSRDITLKFKKRFKLDKEPQMKRVSLIANAKEEAKQDENIDEDAGPTTPGIGRSKAENQKMDKEIKSYVVKYFNQDEDLDKIDIGALLKEYKQKIIVEKNNLIIESAAGSISGSWRENETDPFTASDLEDIESQLPFMYEIIFREAIDLSNEIYLNSKNFDLMERLSLKLNSNKKLRNIWDEMNLDPVGPFADFSSSKETLKYWRQYEVNEKKKKSYFSNMERIKLLNNLILRQINILALMSRELLDYFPLHFHFQLKGKKQGKYLKNLYEDKTLEEDKIPLSKKFIDSVYEHMKKGGTEEVGDEIKRKKIKKISQNTSLTTVYDDTRFNLRKPWAISVVALRNYFGEKIAIYFKFLSEYTKLMGLMAVIGIIVELLIRLGTEPVADWGKILFCFAIILWSTLFLELWKRSQATFAIKFGQIGFEEDEAERPSFQGRFYRSIVTDDLNEGYFSPFKRKIRMLISYFFSLLLISMVIFFVILIFALKSYLINKDVNFLAVNLLGSVLNSVQIIIFNIIYDWISLKLNNFENHKILTTYENSLVFKSFIFNFVNYFNSLVILSFFDNVFVNLDLCIVKKEMIDAETIVNGVKKVLKQEVKTRSCFDVLSAQMQIIFIVNIIKNIPELALPLVKNFFKKSSKTRKFAIYDINPFKTIDENLEKQYSLEPYATNLEVDGTVSDYLELAVQFGFLCLFSVAFPSAFSLAFINNIAEIQVDKIKLLKLSRRPIPIGADNIGIWFAIFDLISYLAIFCNAALIAYTGNVFPDNRNYAFTILLVLFLGIKFCVRLIVPDVPQKAATLLKRHQYIIERVTQGSQSNRKRNFKPLRCFDGRIGGVAYEGERNKQE